MALIGFPRYNLWYNSYSLFGLSFFMMLVVTKSPVGDCFNTGNIVYYLMLLRHKGKFFSVITKYIHTPWFIKQGYIKKLLNISDTESFSSYWTVVPWNFFLTFCLHLHVPPSCCNWSDVFGFPLPFLEWGF